MNEYNNYSFLNHLHISLIQFYLSSIDFKIDTIDLNYLRIGTNI